MRWASALKALTPVLVLLACVVFFLVEPLPLSALRLSGFDLYQRLQPREYQPVPVKVVDIDEASLARVGQWPWPRTVIAELVEALDARGAAAIVFDVMFAEPDRSSPQRMLNLWSLDEVGRAALAGLPDHDEVLAETLIDRPVVMGYALTRGGAETAAEGGPPRLTGPWRYVERGEPVAPFLHDFTGIVPSLPELVAAAEGYGALSFIPDHDGVVRRVPLVLGLAGRPVPTLVSEALRVGFGEQTYVLRTAGSDGAGLVELRVGPVSVPTTARGELWVHYSRPHPHRTVPAWQLLASVAGDAVLDAGPIDGHVVLIGSSAQGLMDLRFSPLGGVMPGVEVHAQALEQILSQHTLDRPNWAKGFELVALLTGGLLVMVVGLTMPALVSAGTSLLVAGGLVWGAWHAFSVEAVLLDATLPVLSVALVFIAATLIRHLSSEQRQTYLKNAFARYTSPNLVEYLVSHPEALALGGERRVCSFIFTDLAGFTSMMEKLDPAEAVGLINAYLDRMIAIAFEHEGTLDRIIGDAVAILFSAPLAQPDHAQRALSCALAMKQFADEYAADLQARGVPFGHTRFGVHTGEVIVGNFGGSTIFDYRALGDPVNTAARLESVNKHLGTRICVSETCLAGCTGILARPVGRLVLKGKQQALQVYEPVAAPDESVKSRFAAYAAAYALLVEDDQPVEATEAAFADLHVRYPDDPLVALHLQRLRTGERGDLIVMAEK